MASAGKRKRAAPLVHQRARRLRREQTDAEAKLWNRIRARRLNGFHFRRQFPISNFIADFCCHESRLVVELDGGKHVERASYDAWRTSLIAERGYRVIRFWDNEVLTNIEGVIEAILTALEETSPFALSLDKERV